MQIQPSVKLLMEQEVKYIIHFKSIKYSATGKTSLWLLINKPHPGTVILIVTARLAFTFSWFTLAKDRIKTKLRSSTYTFFQLKNCHFLWPELYEIPWQSLCQIKLLIEHEFFDICHQYSSSLLNEISVIKSKMNTVQFLQYRPSPSKEICGPENIRKPRGMSKMFGITLLTLQKPNKMN